MAEEGRSPSGSFGGTGDSRLGREGGFLIRVFSRCGNQQCQASLDKEDLVEKTVSEYLTSSANQQQGGLWNIVYDMEIRARSFL